MKELCLILLILLAGGCLSLVKLHNKKADVVSERKEEALAHYGVAALLSEYDPENSTDSIISHYRRAIELDPEEINLAIELAVVFLEKGKYKEAAELFERIVKFSSTDATVLQALGVIYEIGARTNEALDAYMKCLKLDKTNWPVYVRIASIYAEIGDDDSAIKTLDKALTYAERLNCSKTVDEIVNGTIDIIKNLIERKDSLERGERYISFIQDFTDEHCKREIFSSKLYYFLKKEEKEKTEDLLKKAVVELPDDFYFPSLLAVMLSIDRRYKDSAEYFNMAYQRLKKANMLSLITADFYLYFGAAHERAGNIKEAERIFLESLEFFPDDHRILNYLAYMWAEDNRNLDSALEYINKALKVEPNNGAYIDTLGWILYKQGKFEEALEYLLTAAEFEKDDPVIFEHIGDVYCSLGNNEQAVVWWKKSFSLQENPSADLVNKLQKAGVEVEKAFQEK